MPRHHPRSPYATTAPDFTHLSLISPNLAPFINSRGTIDFTDALAVTALTQSLLSVHWGVHGWTLPLGRLVPALPSRLNYILAVQDRLASRVPLCFYHHHTNRCHCTCGSTQPLGLDVGTGASAILALLSTAAIGACAVATDCDAEAVTCAKANIIAAGPRFSDALIIVHTNGDESNNLLGALEQTTRPSIFLQNLSSPTATSSSSFSPPSPPLPLPPLTARMSTLSGVTHTSSTINITTVWNEIIKVISVNGKMSDFDFTLANPPFFTSLTEAQASMDNFTRSTRSGVAAELACDGGEINFVARLIHESAKVTKKGTLFTTWLGFGASIAPLRAVAHAMGARDVRVIAQRAGVTTRWVLSWTFQSELSAVAKGWRPRISPPNFNEKKREDVESHLCGGGAAAAAAATTTGSGNVVDEQVTGLKRTRYSGGESLKQQSSDDLIDSDDDGAGGGDNIRVFTMPVLTIGHHDTIPSIPAHVTRVGNGVFSLCPSARDVGRLRKSATTESASAAGVTAPVVVDLGVANSTARVSNELVPLSILSLCERIEEALASARPGLPSPSASETALFYWRTDDATIVDTLSALNQSRSSGDGGGGGGGNDNNELWKTVAVWRIVIFGINTLSTAATAATATATTTTATNDDVTDVSNSSIITPFTLIEVSIIMKNGINAMITSSLISEIDGFRPFFDRFSNSLESDVQRISRRWRRRGQVRTDAGETEGVKE